MLSMAQRVTDLTEYDFTSHVDFVHGANNDKCFVTLFKKGLKTNFHRHFNSLDSLKIMINNFFEQNNNIDLYMSMNTFFKPERNLESLRYLNTLHMDLDTYKTKFTKTQILMRLEAEYFNKTIPRPNLIIDSGRGLNLIWTIEAVPSQALSLWKALMYKFYNELKEFGADNAALDPTRVLRVIGSINSKTYTEVTLLESYDYKYSLRELKTEYLPEVEKKEKNKKIKTERKIINFFTPMSLEKARIDDLEKLCELRDYNLEGCREYLLFYYRYLLCRNYDKEYALEKTEELNSKFNNPLSIGEVRSSTKSGERYAEKDKYRFSSNRLIELFDISEEEQKQLKTIHCKKVKYENNNEKRKAKRRNENGLTLREQRKLDTLKLIYKLKADNLNNNEIAEKLDISIRQIQRYNKEIETLEVSRLTEMELSPKEIVYEDNSVKEIKVKSEIIDAKGLDVSFKNEIIQPLFVIHRNIYKEESNSFDIFKGS